jgi:hypothetical protein
LLLESITMTLAEILSRGTKQVKPEWPGGPLRVFAAGNPEPGAYVCAGCRRESRAGVHFVPGHGWWCVVCKERLIRSSLAHSGRFRDRGEQFVDSDF